MDLRRVIELELVTKPHSLRQLEQNYGLEFSSPVPISHFQLYRVDLVEMHSNRFPKAHPGNFALT